MSGFICNTLNLSKPSPTLASEFCHLWHHNGKRGKIKRYWQSLVELTCEICVNNIKQVFFGGGVGVESLYPSASWKAWQGIRRCIPRSLTKTDHGMRVILSVEKLCGVIFERELYFLRTKLTWTNGPNRERVEKNFLVCAYFSNIALVHLVFDWFP